MAKSLSNLEGYNMVMARTNVAKQVTTPGFVKPTKKKGKKKKS